MSSTTDSQEIDVADVIDPHKQIVDAMIPTPRQIPRPPDDFKGREQEINDILANFDKGATITGLRGMAGIGKTVLAFVLADKLKEFFSTVSSS